MEPESSRRFTLTQKEVAGISCNKGYSNSVKEEKKVLLWGWSNTGPDV